MGRSYTPAYRVETNDRCVHGSMEWRCRRRGQVPGYGNPTEANLAKWVEKFNASLKPGGVNEHVGDRARVFKAQIVDQFSGTVVATYEAPMFQVV